MRKLSTLMMILILSFLSGCNKDVIRHNYCYKGANENWKAMMIYHGQEVFTTKKDGALDYENEDESKLLVTYVGERTDFSEIKYIEISCEYSSGKSSFREDYTDGPPKELFYTISGGGRNSALMRKDDVLKVTIDLSGEIQTFDLKDE